VPCNLMPRLFISLIFAEALIIRHDISH
jgi:hypothetical protein